MKKLENTEKLIPLVVHYSWDCEVPVYLFENEEDAKSELKRQFDEELRIATEENGHVVDEDLKTDFAEDGSWASITTYWDDQKDVMEWAIGTVRKPGLNRDAEEKVWYTFYTTFNDCDTSHAEQSFIANGLNEASGETIHASNVDWAKEVVDLFHGNLDQIMQLAGKNAELIAPYVCEVAGYPWFKVTLNSHVAGSTGTIENYHGPYMDIFEKPRTRQEEEEGIYRQVKTFFSITAARHFCINNRIGIIDDICDLTGGGVRV